MLVSLKPALFLNCLEDLQPLSLLISDSHQSAIPLTHYHTCQSSPSSSPSSFCLPSAKPSFSVCEYLKLKEDTRLNSITDCVLSELYCNYICIFLHITTHGNLPRHFSFMFSFHLSAATFFICTWSKQKARAVMII